MLVISWFLFRGIWIAIRHDLSSFILVFGRLYQLFLALRYVRSIPSPVLW